MKTVDQNTLIGLINSLHYIDLHAVLLYYHVAMSTYIHLTAPVLVYHRYNDKEVVVNFSSQGMNNSTTPISQTDFHFWTGCIPVNLVKMISRLTFTPPE